MDVRPEFPLPDITWEPTRPFWDGAARGELLVPRCDACGSFTWYPRATCPYCRGEAFTWTAMSGRGVLFSWVVVRHAFLPQFRDKVPFVPGLVSLEEDPGVRLATEIVDCDLDALDFDMPLQVVFRPISFPGVAGEVAAPLFTPVG